MSWPYPVLFAQEQAEPPPPPARKDPKDAIKSDALWITVGLLLLVLLVGIVVLAYIDRWRKRSAPFEKDSVEEVSNFRDLYESGEITQGEYERIRAKMAGRVKEKVGVKPSAVPPSTAEAAPSADGPADNPSGPGK
jgi:hypothetical protein